MAGEAGELHTAAPPETAHRVARVLEVERPCVVLGSSQDATVVDSVRAESAGVSIARRRSGGGVVWLAPGDQCWVDLWLPAGDPLWVDDVVAAAFWAGEAWAAAASDLGNTVLGNTVLGNTVLGNNDTVVHRGGLEPTPHSDLVCFAGRGPGEVFVGNRKLVGISQRRTRDWVRLQTMAYRVWEPGRLVDVLSLTDRERAVLVTDLGDAAAALGDPADVIDALRHRLP